MTQAPSHYEHGHDDEHGHSDGHGHDGEPHVLPLSIYIGVWLTLVVLTAITVVASRFDFGSANTVVAMLIATIKGSLVALFFMHLYYDNKLNLIILVTSLLFVSIFFTPVLIDLATRDALDPVKGHAYYLMSKLKPEPMPMPPAATAPAAAPAPAAPATPTAAEPGATPAAAPAPAVAPTAAPAPGHPAAPAAPASPPAGVAAPAGHVPAPH